MLSKKIKTTDKNKSSVDGAQKLVLVKNTKEQKTSFNPDYQVYNDNCNLNYWGAGFMGKDLMF